MGEQPMSGRSDVQNFLQERGRSPLERAAELAERYPEMVWLVGEGTEATPEKSHAAGGKTVGAQLFPDAEASHLTEFDRAFVGIEAFHWVLDGDYESFTACQPEAAKLSRETFDWLGAFTRHALPNQEALDAMETFIAINDDGKIEAFAKAVRAMPDAPDTVDHDVVMLHGLQRDPSLSPSFARLSPDYQKVVLEGLITKFNLAQFMQAENVAASLSGLAQINDRSKQFHVLHALYDLAGAAGQFIQNGSITIDESTVRNFNDALDSLQGIGTTKSVEQAYNAYIAKKARNFSITLNTPEDLAVTRLGTMLRMSNPEQASRLRDVFEALPRNVQAILNKELDQAGTESLASLAYYAPGLLANLHNQAKTPEDWQTNMALGMTTLARVFQAARARQFAREWQSGGVQTIMIKQLAAAAAQDPNSLGSSKIRLSGKGLDLVASLETPTSINLDGFHRLENLEQIPGQRIAIVGMGGGSDGVQAAMLAKLLEGAGKDCPAVISVRTEKPMSQSLGGAQSSQRQVDNHGGELANGVFRITPNTTGTGRFLEHLPAQDQAMFLAIENGREPLTNKLQAVLDAVGGVDTVIGLDTGGDVLYRSTGLDQAESTPDQDQVSLRAVASLKNVTSLCCIVAPGIDSPPYAEEELHARRAVYFEPNTKQTATILDTYKRWHMDGSDDRYFGKTPLAWQAVLSDKQSTGITVTNLPEAVVLDEHNPWDPFVTKQPAMRGMFFSQVK